MLKELEDYDWREAFGYVGEPDTCAGSDNAPDPVIGYTGSLEPFSREDVAVIIASSEGENDGADWLIVVELKDGRFAFVRAGCDNTGWDCQAGGNGWVSDNLNDLIRLGIGQDERGRLGLAIAGAP